MRTKTKFMAQNGPGYADLTYNQSFVIDSYNFEVVTEFIYLGSLKDCKIYLEEKAKCRITKGNSCYTVCRNS
jgi:hypothetical protein